MTFDELRPLIESKITEAAWQFEGPRDHPLSNEELLAIEDERNVVLPSDYKSFIQIYGAGEFGFGQVYSPDPKSGYSLWQDASFVSGALPFTDNGGGDYLCFRLEGISASDEILWADHEQDYSLSSSEYDGFCDFVLRDCLRADQ